MSTTKHTPVPWFHKREITRGEFVTEDRIRTADNGCIATVGPMASEANAARIVACVNAMEGVPDPEALMALVRDMAEMGSFPPHEGKGNALRELLGAAIAKAEGK